MTLLLSVLVIFFGWRLQSLAAQELQKVRISYSSRSNSTTVYQVALARGFFKEEGLEAEMIQMNPRLGGLAVAMPQCGSKPCAQALLKSSP